MAGKDVLQRIAAKYVPKLLDVLKEDLPTSSVAYHWLTVQTKWSEKIPGMSVHVLCPGGRWQHGTVVAYTDGLALANKKYGVVYARPRHDAELAAALTSTRAVPWRDMLHFGGVLEKNVEMVRAGAKANGVTSVKEPTLSHLLYYPAAPAINIEARRTPEENVRVCRLEGRHLDEVWRLRPLFPDSYKPVIRACLEHNLSAGVFVTRPDGSEVLASMMLQTEYGGMGMGQTLPEFLHRGFNSVAGSFLMRAMGKAEIEIHGWTSTTNQVTIKYMKQYGVQFVGKVAHLALADDASFVKGRL